MYDGIPLLLESVRCNSDCLLDILSGSKEKAGVRLVSFLDRVNSADECEIAARKLLNSYKYTRDAFSDLLPRNFNIHFQHLFYTKLLPIITDKQYERVSIIIFCFNRHKMSLKNITLCFVFRINCKLLLLVVKVVLVMA